MIGSLFFVDRDRLADHVDGDIMVSTLAGDHPE
jgi:hypothetical protein